MKRNTIYLIAGVAAAVLIVAVGSFMYLRGPANQGGVPPLPANARMFNNWALVGCQANANNGRCVLLRRAVNQQTQRLVMQMTIARAQNGNPIMAITLPPNIGIANGVTLTPMGGTAVRGAIRSCRPQACVGAIVLSEMLQTELAATNTAALQFASANGRGVRMNVNIQGFAQGFAAWQAAAPVPPAAAAPAAPATPGAPAAAAAQPAAKAPPPAAPAPAAPAGKAAPAPAAK